MYERSYELAEKLIDSNIKLGDISKIWYEIIYNDTLEQGDILEKITVVRPSIELITKSTDTVPYETYDEVIILTQSCDLGHEGKTEWVLVTPVHKLSEKQAEEQKFKDLTLLENIRHGFVPKYHMLSNWLDRKNAMEREISIIDFRNVFSIPIEYAMSSVTNGTKRWRLNSPYKESLGQAYARFYMRIGFPTDIPRFIDIAQRDADKETKAKIYLKNKGYTLIDP